MRIGALARTVGMSPMAIRYYESMGLLPRPGRTESNYRIYGTEDVERLQFIKKAKRLGLSLQEISGILSLYERQEATCVHVRALLDEKLAEVDSLLRDLKGFRAELSRLREAAGTMVDCRPAGGRICGIIEESVLGTRARAQAALNRAREQSSQGRRRLRGGPQGDQA